jgi:rod shape-determining protein MreC
MNTSSSFRPLQTIVFVLVAVGLIALALGGYLAPVSRILLRPAVEAQAWITSRYQAVGDLINAPQDMARLRQENAQLVDENAQLKGQIIELQEQLSETNILSALVDFSRANPEYNRQAAAIIGYDTSPFLRYVIINRGSDHGLRKGMPVVTQEGLVGRIAAVTSIAARVQLITDSASTVNVHLQPSNIQAVIQGSLTGEIAVDMIPQDVNVQVGDLVVTSGLGGGYPANLLVGQVTGTRSREQDLFQRASVQSAVDFTQLEIVLVITDFKPVNFEPLLPTPGAP